MKILKNIIFANLFMFNLVNAQVIIGDDNFNNKNTILGIIKPSIIAIKISKASKLCPSINQDRPTSTDTNG